MAEKSEVIFEIWRTRERRCYFLMSSAGAGIGYALATVAGVLSVPETRLLLLSLLLWSLSFLIGLRVVSQIWRLMGTSIMLMDERERIPALADEQHDGLSRKSSALSSDLGRQGRRVEFLQLLFLLLGALVFIELKVDALESLKLG